MTNSEDILQRIAVSTRTRVAAEKETMPAEELRDRAIAAADAHDDSAGDFFERAIAAPGLSLICECKKASPSKGLIAPDYDPVAIARDYDAAGAAAVSCLTEPAYFQGSLEDLRDVAAAVRIPVLRKDFVVDDYMLYQARLSGAAAVLLIVAILSDEELAHCLEVCRRLRLGALVEAYTEDELARAVANGASVIGVNNRDLRDFSVDFGHARHLREMVPADRLFVSESGVSSLEDVARVAEMNADAALVGEYLMRAPDRQGLLEQMLAASEGVVA